MRILLWAERFSPHVVGGSQFSAELALAQRIERLLGRPEESRRMGTIARRRCEKLFGFDRIADAYARLYQKIALDCRVWHEEAKVTE